MSESRIDVIELELLWARVTSIADEMQSMLIRTALSTVIRINIDCATALFDQDGTMLAQPTSCAPGHIASMPRLMETFLKELPVDKLNSGDVFIANDPWIGAGHTPDVYIISPVFERDHLVGFVATVAHQIDFGGRIGAIDSADVFEEGLIFPITHLYTAGVRNDEVFRLIGSNVRMSDKILHDLQAQIACNELGEMRLKELMLEFELADLRPLATEIVNATDRAMRERLVEIGNFSTRAEQEIEVWDEEGRPLRVVFTLEIRDGEVHVDYTGSSPQVKVPVNCVFNYTLSYSVLGLKFILAPDLPYNAGIQRPFKITAPEGSILNAAWPAPVRWRITVGQQIPELMIRALTPHLPDRVIADSGSSPMWLWMFSGWDPRRGGRFVFQSHFMGGLGARSDKDGTPTTSLPFNMSDTPVEVWENEVPILVGQRSLIPDSGGAGEFRGGLGQRIEFGLAPDSEQLDGPLSITLSGGRFQEPPRGLLGGEPGRRGRVMVDGVAFDRPLGGMSVNRTTKVTLEVPGGGGVGDPSGRDEQRVRDDIEDGFVTLEAARAVYKATV